ncbi:MAG: anti-sigma factor [Trebonia sp.]
MSLQRHDLHQLTGAYAADALTGAELAQFEKHLGHCPSCAEEVRGLREAAARLGIATSIVPPPAMRRQVLEAASRTRQLAPAGRRLLDSGTPARGGWLRRALPRPVSAAAMTALAAAVVVLGIVLAGTQHRLEQAQSANQAVAAVLAAPGARIVTSGTTVGGTVTAVVSARDHEAVVTAAGMPAPPASRVYQLWLISVSGARSAGLMPASSTGSTSPVLTADIQPGDHLGITIEPAGGSARPTTTPVVLLSVSA